VIGNPAPSRGRRVESGSPPRGVDKLTFERERQEVLIELKGAHPTMPPDERNAEAQRILLNKYRA